MLIGSVTQLTAFSKISDRRTNLFLIFIILTPTKILSINVVVSMCAIAKCVVPQNICLRPRLFDIFGDTAIPHVEEGRRGGRTKKSKRSVLPVDDRWHAVRFSAPSSASAGRMLKKADRRERIGWHSYRPQSTHFFSWIFFFLGLFRFISSHFVCEKERECLGYQ